MSGPKLYIYIAFSLLAISLTSLKQQSDCENWEITENVIHQDNGLITLELQVDFATAKLHYVFFEEQGNLISRNFESNKMEDLKPGKYEYTVVGNGCRVHNKIILK